MDKMKRFKNGVIIAILAGGVLWMVTPDVGENEAKQAAEALEIDVDEKCPDFIKKIQTAQTVEIVDVYDAKALLQQLKHYRDTLRKNATEAETLCKFIEIKNDEPQYQHVVDDCSSKIVRLGELAKKQGDEKNSAQELYDATLRNWELSSATGTGIDAALHDLRNVREKLNEYKKQAETGAENSDGDWAAYDIYDGIKEGLTPLISRIDAEIKRLEDRGKDYLASKSEVIGQTGQIDYNLPKMREIVDVLSDIKATPNLLPPYPEVPIVLEEEEPQPPPAVIEPDIRLAATGDLGQALLEPLVEKWLTANGATPLHGSTFIWNVQEGSRMLEVNAPEDMQGAEAGKLRILISGGLSKEAAFAAVSRTGDADLILTGLQPTHDMEKAWLPEGKTLQELDTKTMGRAYRARVCYDAVVFFRGNKVKENTISAKGMRALPKVFSTNDIARSEAVAVFGMQPESQDSEELGEKSLSQKELCSKYEDKVVLGVWHRDAGANVAVRNTPAISYAVSWDKETLKSIPDKYEPGVEGVLPSEETIATGRYAYSYSIYGYCSTREPSARRSQLAGRLLSYMADAEDSKVAETIKSCRFVPVMLSIGDMSRSIKLTKDDIPLAVLFEKLGTQKVRRYGYDPKTPELGVYGIRIPVQLHYEVGSTESNTMLDPDGHYYASSDKLLSAIGKELQGVSSALVVVLGHADPSWNAKLDVGIDSWRNNLSLSEKRAENVSNSNLKSQLTGLSGVEHVFLGTSWARPARDIVSDRPLEEQEKALELCRRVEVFLIFPVPGSPASAVQTPQ